MHLAPVTPLYVRLGHLASLPKTSCPRPAPVPVPEPARDPPLARRAAVRHVPRDCGRTLSRSPPPPAPRQAGLADEVYSEGGGVKQKSGLLSAFSFVPPCPSPDLSPRERATFFPFYFGSAEEAKRCRSKQLTPSTMATTNTLPCSSSGFCESPRFGRA